jgi:hypothetical protein
VTPERLDALVGGGDPSEEEKHEYRRRLIARAEDGEAYYDYGPGYSSTRSGTPTAGKSLRGDGEALFLLRRLEHLHGLFPSVQEALKDLSLGARCEENFRAHTGFHRKESSPRKPPGR